MTENGYLPLLTRPFLAIAVMLAYLLDIRNWVMRMRESSDPSFFHYYKTENQLSKYLKK